MASNSNTLLDADGDSSDWIEIENATASPVDLAGWYLTDDSSVLTKWQFPAVSLLPDTRLIVFASGKDRVDPLAELHTNFKLKRSGEFLALVEADGVSIASQFSPSYPSQQPDISYGFDGAGNERYFPVPTPGEVNNAGVAGLVDANQFTVDRGFFDAPFQVEITNGTPGAAIFYTTDGSVPNEVDGLPYTGPITVDTTTVLRAAAFKPDFLPSRVGTQTYLFLDDVIRQPAEIPWIPNRPYDVGNGATALHDNEMDPQIVDDPAYSGIVLDAMRSIPTMSIVADPDEVFGETGFYDGEDVKKGVSVEVLYADDPARNHQANSEIESHSHERLKRSLRLNFDKGIGDGSFVTDLFQTGPLHGDSAPGEVRRVILRGGNNRSWARDWNPDKTAYTIDEFYRQTQVALSGYGSRGTFVHLYINGVYWGLYNPVERPDARFTSSTFGGDKDDWFFIKHGGTEKGDSTRYDYLTQNLILQDLSDPATYDEFRQYLDVEGFSDYLIASWWTATGDWPGNNFYGGNRNDTSALGTTPFRYFAWDGEWSWDAPRDFSNPGHRAHVHPDFQSDQSGGFTISRLWHAARQNDDFLMLFADRVYRHLFNDGPLTDANAQARWLTLNQFVRDAVVAESARWGDALEGLGDPTRTRDIDWQNEVDTIHGLLDGNAQVFIDALRAEGYYPNTDPPLLSHRGGTVPVGFELTIQQQAASGTTYYTLDGTDPRLPGGAVAPAALVSDGTPIVLASSGQVVTRTLGSDGQWSARDEATFLLSDLPTLRITELMYNPAAPSEDELAAGFTDNDQFEFLELRNAGSQPIDLSGIALTRGVTFDFSASAVTHLPAGGHVLVVSDLQAFAQRYPAAAPLVAGQYSGRLSNGGEQIVLGDALGRTLHDFTYDDKDPWPVEADGGGRSLEVIDVDGDYNSAANWRASGQLGGTPGSGSAEPETSIFAPTDDAYIENGSAFDAAVLKAEQGGNVRTSYLKFDLGTLAGDTITSALLHLTVEQDPGQGTLRVAAGSHSNWTEETIDPTTAPAAGTESVTLSGSFSLGQLLEFDVTSLVAAGEVQSLVLSIDGGGNDVWLSSKEGPAVPQLIVESLPGSPPQNRPPVARSEGYTVAEGGTVDTLNDGLDGLLANDDDPDGDRLTATVVDPPLNGSLLLRPDGTFVYTHDDSETALDRFTYEASDGALASPPTEVTITVTPVNDNPPVAVDDAATVPLGGRATIEVLRNDVDPDLPNDQLAIVSVGGTAFGTATTDGRRVFYEPTDPAATSDRVLYTIADSMGRESTAEVAISIVPAEPVTTELAPIADAYLENGADKNDLFLKVEQSATTRISYLKFDLSGLAGETIVSARLELTVSTDPGEGTVRVARGSHSDWDEVNLAPSTAPQAELPGVAISGVLGNGQIAVFDVTPLIGTSGLQSFVVTMDAGGNDAWFGSRESSVPPRLVVDSLTGGGPVNAPPIVDAGADQTLAWPARTVSLSGTVSDDGLPDPPGDVTAVWSQVSGPGTVVFGDAGEPATSATFPEPGTYRLRLTANDGAIAASDEMTVAVVTDAVSATFTPTDDAYIEDGLALNNPYLKAEQVGRTRKSYLKFDVEGTAGRTVTAATLRLTVFDDAGKGTLELYEAASTDWTETTLSPATAPAAGSLLDAVPGMFSLSSPVEWDVTRAVTGDGLVGFVLQIGPESNDVWFSSKEGPWAPVLVVEMR